MEKRQQMMETEGSFAGAANGVKLDESEVKGYARRFLDGKPAYLVNYYWWAYLWGFGVWLFDHQPIINAILFGQYQKLMGATMQRVALAPRERVLQLTCVYGSLIPNLSKAIGDTPLHLTDVAEVQLALARRKIAERGKLAPTRMNAEQLAYKTDTFSTVVLFFLLHEMPHAARVRTLTEAVRVIRPGGTLLVTEYAPQPLRHFLYRLLPFRAVLTRLEPFLAGFWREDVEAVLRKAASACGKQVYCSYQQDLFAGFYRVSEYRLE